MFVVRDWTRNPSYTMVSNDVKDVRDIVIGITGDETIGDHVLLHLGHMIFGQFLVWGPLVIRCVPDEDAQALYLKGGDRMEKILRLNEQDIVQALADHFNVDRAKVNLTVKIRTEGYGPTEHQFPEVSAVIKEG